MIIRPSPKRKECVVGMYTGDSLCCASEEGPSALTAEVKQERLSQTAPYSTSHNELMEPSDIKMYPSDDTPAPGELEQLEDTAGLMS